MSRRVLIKISRAVSVGVFIVLMFLTLNSIILRHSLVALLTVSGSSMYPNISPADMLFCVSTKLTGVQVGDVYVYMSNYGRYVVHRVIGQNGNMYLFKGDNNLYEDGYVPYDNIVCKVLFHIPRLVWITVFTVVLSISYAYTLSRHKHTEYVSVAMVLALVIVVSAGVIQMKEVDVYVKPNPMPVSSNVYYYNGKTYIELENWRLVDSVSCSDGFTPVACRLLGFGVVEVDSNSPMIILRMKVKSGLNIVVEETVSRGVFP